MAGFVPPPYPYERLDPAAGGGRRARRGSSRPVDRHALRSAAGGGGRRARPLRRGAGLPAVGRYARVPGGGGGLDGSPAGCAGRPVRRGGVHRQQGAGRRRSAVASAAHTRAGHRAVPGDQLPDLRDGGDPRRLPGRPGRRRRSVAPRPRLDRRGRRGAGAVPLGQHPGQPGRRSRRPRRRRPGAGPTPSRSSPTSATSSSRGTDRPARSSSTGPTASSRCTRSRSARTWPVRGSASTPATPTSCTTSREVRKHAGFMVPGPVQVAAIAAWADDDPVDAQRARYRERLDLLAGVLRTRASTCHRPAGRSTSGSRRPTATPGASPSGWRGVRARRDPGRVLRPRRLGHVRLAVVQPTERIRLVADRLASSRASAGA